MLQTRPECGELLDQPRRQNLSFGRGFAALEADPHGRGMKLVILVHDRFPEVPPYRPIEEALEGRSRAAPRWARTSCDQWARDLVAALVHEFSGTKLTGSWIRWLIHKTDGVLIGTPTHDLERGTLECRIRVDENVNYDLIYRRVLDVLKRQPGYQREGTTLSPFSVRLLDEIERMPREEDSSES